MKVQLKRTSLFEVLVITVLTIVDSKTANNKRKYEAKFGPEIPVLVFTVCDLSGT